MKKKLNSNLALYFILSIMCSMCFTSCENKEEKQEKAIREFMNKTYADFPNYECVQTEYLDSIQDNPFDYEGLILGLMAYKSCLGIAKPAYNLVQSALQDTNLPEGKYTLNVDSFSEKTEQKYFVWMDSVRVYAVARDALMKKVENFKPYSYNRVFKKYRVITDGKANFIHARFYFDEDCNLTKQLILKEEDSNCASGMICMAKQHDFSNLNQVFNKQIDLPNEEILNYLANYPKMPIIQLIHQLNSQASNSIPAEAPKDINIEESKYNLESSSTTSSTSGNVYIVTSKCGGTISKEAEKRFTKYAVSGNTSGIDEMF